ncbi:hypothetical protein JCM3775_003066 [Rhodotorula graminis]
MRPRSSTVALCALLASLVSAIPLTILQRHRQQTPDTLFVGIRDSSDAFPAVLYRSTDNVTCSTYKITFGGSQPPFHLSVVGFANPDTALMDIGDYGAAGTTLWAVEVEPGRTVRVKMTDAAGNTRMTAASTVQDGRPDVPFCSSSSDGLGAGYYAFVLVAGAFGLSVLVLAMCLVRSACRAPRDVRRIRRSSPVLPSPSGKPPPLPPRPGSAQGKKGSTTPTGEPPMSRRDGGRRPPAPQHGRFHEVDLKKAAKEGPPPFVPLPPPRYQARAPEKQSRQSRKK